MTSGDGDRRAQDRIDALVRGNREILRERLALTKLRLNQPGSAKTSRREVDSCLAYLCFEGSAHQLHLASVALNVIATDPDLAMVPAKELHRRITGKSG